MAISESEFKQAMQLWASGVTVVTTSSPKRGHFGITVTAFASVSAEPAQVLCCLFGESETAVEIEKNQSFAINVLTTYQEETSWQFAGGISQEERFSRNVWHTAITGAPLLSNSLFSFDCRLVNQMAAGTHKIFIGEVLASECRKGGPLIYHHTGYPNAQ